MNTQKKTGPTAPEILTVTTDDILESLAGGLRDFRSAPLFSLAFGGIYAVAGWFLLLMLLKFDLPFLVYPMAAGFALIAPFIATGFYAISRALEDGGQPSWGGLMDDVLSSSKSDLGWMAIVTGFSLFIWMDIAALLFFGFLGLNSLNVSDTVSTILTTPAGLVFLLIGNAAGAVIAMFVFSFSVISFPLLFDRNIDFVTAMITSVRLVRANFAPMAIWCVVIAVLVGLSLLSGLVGLFVILPVLGHATWHLYRRSVSLEGVAG